MSEPGTEDGPPAPPVLPAHAAGPSTAQAWIVAGLLFLTGIAVFFLGKFGGERMGADQELALLRGVVALLCAWAAILWLLLVHTRRELADVLDTLEDLRLGTETRRSREAVDLLLKAIRMPDRKVADTALSHLRRITGEDLGPDPRRWEEWWERSRDTFVRPGKK